jgi:hypothetical protein
VDDALDAAASLAFVMFSRRSRRAMSSVSLSRSPAIFVARSVRFAREITFPDYSVDELQAIFHQMLAQHEYTLEPGADQMLRRILTGLHAGEDSGNARFARTLFEQALNRQALRLSLDEEQSLDALDREAVMTLTAEDNAEAALALGEEPEPEAGPAPEREQSRWWRWLL